MSAAACPSCAAPVSLHAASCALCDAVLRDAPLEAPPAPRARAARPPLARRALRPLAVTVTAVALLYAATGIGLAAWAARQHRAHVARSLDTAPRRGATAPWTEIERAVARSAAFRGRAAAPDLAGARMLLAFALPTTRGQQPFEWLAAFDVDTAGFVPEPASRSGSEMVRRVDSLLRMPDARLTPAQRASLAADTVARALPLFRRVAAGGQLPRLWPYKADFGGVPSVTALPMPRFAGTKELAYRNAAAALLAADAGDFATAERRARENIAVGEAWLRVPRELTNLVGRGMVIRGAEVLARVGRASGDTALVREGTALATRLEHAGRDAAVWWRARAQAPGDTAGAAAAGDTAIAVAMRVEAARGAMMASCGSARELLLGPDADRREMLVAAGARLRDIDADGRLARLLAAEFDAWNADAASLVDGPLAANYPPRASITALRAAGLGGLVGRLRRCETGL